MSDGALHRIEAGTGEPVVVLEAGRNNVAASWRAVMALVAPHVHVVAYDRAGLGGSAPVPSPNSGVVARQIRDLASVIADADAGPCVLAGHSWGGMLAQLLAFHRPELVAGLVLVDPGHERMTEALPRAARWGLERVGRLRTEDLRGTDPEAGAAAFRELRSSPRPFPDVPVVVLSAARGFPRRFRTHWTELQAGLAASAAKGRHIVVDGTGHEIPRQRPDAVAEAILQVVAEARAG